MGGWVSSQLQEVAKCGAVVSVCGLPLIVDGYGVASLVDWLVVLRPQEAAQCSVVVSACADASRNICCA